MSSQPPPSGGRQPGPGQGTPPGGQKSGWPKWTIWVLIAVLLGALLLTNLLSSSGGQEISYADFRTQVTNGNVTKVTVNNDTGGITGTYADGTSFSTTGPMPLPDADLDLLRTNNVNYEFTTPQPNFLTSLLPLLIPVVLFVGLFFWLQRRAAGQMSGVMSIGRSKAKMFSADRPSTTFADIAGYEGVKQEIKEVVDFLKAPEKFREIGARTPKGILLVGPPGTGKTLFARAVAGEAGVAFLSVTGSDFMEMFVGVGAARVRDMFQQARKMGRAIIFVDEIDSIGRKRGAGLGGGHDEREQTLNQMLAEMDGFETTEGIVMMAATNRPDILDGALLRPGRFDRQIVVPLPEVEERLAILRVHCRGKKLGDSVDLDTMARGTPGMSGADLANLVNESALFAVRRGGKRIEHRDLEDAYDRVLVGMKRDSLALSDEEKRIIAYHEGGHALLSAVLPEADDLHKVSIIPTGMALGVTWTLPEERHLHRKTWFEDSICMRLGGRIAEDLVFGHFSSGAADDLQRNTEIARRMVREWGMSDRVGPMAWGAKGQVFLGEDLISTRDYSDETARIIDEEVNRILRGQEDRARVLLSEHRGGLDLVAAGLLQYETIDGADVTRLIELGRQGVRPGDPRADLPHLVKVPQTSTPDRVEEPVVRSVDVVAPPNALPPFTPPPTPA